MDRITNEEIFKRFGGSPALVNFLNRRLFGYTKVYGHTFLAGRAEDPGRSNRERDASGSLRGDDIGQFIGMAGCQSYIDLKKLVQSRHAKQLLETIRCVSKRKTSRGLKEI